MNREYVLWILSYSLLCFFPGAVPHLTLCHAVSGGTVILPCAIKTSEKLNIFNYSIYWQINTSVVVHFFYNGKDLLKDQSRRYLNRTRLFLDQLERGNFSLMLSGVEPADEEVYTCILRNKGTKITHAVKLNVSSPDNQSIGRNVSPFGQTQDLPNCPGDAKALDILALCSHFLMVLVVWIL
ncbi:CD276 antigen homolog [Dermochelys coriacea]|uniref:CD276 antigen homolog n=1 Tax=Dermochelys coriacea TaxID=27794 RepID=UPI0018E8596F|nr:CD276 antigen homolog [Dermochelys coriacea]XP_043362393.1 CD276 antigen homolog [Dermochelys coriacea]XP_043362409.1 CD276 antigen homolog [Dermochelys coriacea]XP_043362416.1 CD276 antigen homolog [Dermochelys coriacea]